jgi:hypothetical protein
MGAMIKNERSQDLSVEIELGHWHLGFWFVPLFKLTKTGMVLKTQHHAWKDIVDISETHPSMIFLLGYPFGKAKAVITFADGQKIFIDARSFGYRDSRPRVAFWTGVSDVYSAFMERAAKERRGV